MFRDFSEHNFFWVWSRNGPAEEGVLYGRTFRDGHIPWPVPGDIAQLLDAMMYVTRKAEPMEMWAGWEKSPAGQWEPIFKKVEFAKPKRKRGRPKKSEVEATA